MSRRFAGWRMVAIAAVAQNAAIGANSGAYGTMVQTIQADFQTSRPWPPPVSA